jgi:hypothetical protein
MLRAESSLLEGIRGWGTRGRGIVFSCSHTVHLTSFVSGTGVHFLLETCWAMSEMLKSSQFKATPTGVKEIRISVVEIIKSLGKHSEWNWLHGRGVDSSGLRGAGFMAVN